MDKTDFKCLFYEISRSQKETEKSRGEGSDGIEGFNQMGCYDCFGFDYLCNKKINSRMIDKRIR